MELCSIIDSYDSFTYKHSSMSYFVNIINYLHPSSKFSADFSISVLILLILIPIIIWDYADCYADDDCRGESVVSPLAMSVWIVVVEPPVVVDCSYY